MAAAASLSKTDSSNRLADPENLYIYQVSREF